ncbi:MAG TPA: hypothetical protein VL461_10275 [Dictyobacter sp.]|jgi:hypothetical protein|nr:hypothetical protein [Dictyobacter sp.]
MSKVKMRCITCGKWFQSANAKDVTCPDCTQKTRKEKMAAKNAPPVSDKTVSNKPATTPVAKPAVAPKAKSTQHGTASWLDNVSDVKVAQPETPQPQPRFKTPSVPAQHDSHPGQRSVSSPPAYGTEQNRQNATNTVRRPPSYRGGGNNGTGQTYAPNRHPLSTQDGERSRGSQKPWGRNSQGAPNGGGNKPFNKFKSKTKTTRAPAPSKTKKEKTPPPTPFVPTPEQVEQVKERYTILAQPAEFDGIRTQIAKELSIPKKAVKKIVKEIRDQQQIPSWWELQTYKGSNEELERIKTAYKPFLPVPPVGVHKIIADSLDLKPGTVYQAIKAIRLELNLPQYNDPTLHNQGSQMV